LVKQIIGDQMDKALIVGTGFSANIHKEAYEMLGYEVFMVEDRFSIYTAINEITSGEYKAVSLCNSPKNRTKIIEHLLSCRYNYNFPDLLVIEKPPILPTNMALSKFNSLINKYEQLCKDVVVVHNYLYQSWVEDIDLPLEVAILRNGPHRGWYVDTSLTGGGILLDHGYHWFYIYTHYGGDLDSLNITIDNYPDFESTISGKDFKCFLTWKSPLRLTYVNGSIVEPRSKKEQIMSVYNLIKDVDSHGEINAVACEVMERIIDVYKRYSHMLPRDI